MLQVKLLFFACLTVCCLSAQAQVRYYAPRGQITFFSEAPLENIEAQNEKAVSFIDFSTGELVFSVPMKAFEFRKKLMQQHFNENYVESGKYPKATFKGRIVDIGQVDLTKDATYQVRIKGILSIHGQDKLLDTVGTLEVKGKQVLGRSAFSVTPQEFDIRIPRLVQNNIAKRIDITVNMVYELYTGKNL